MAKKKVLQEAVNVAAVVTGHSIDELQPDTSRSVNQVINIAKSVLPLNKTVNITMALIQMVSAALSAYESHVGQPYDPENLPDILPLPLDPADD